MKNYIFWFLVLSSTWESNASKPGEALLELINAHRGKFLRVENETYEGDILIDSLANTTLFFENVVIKGDVTITRITRSNILGRMQIEGNLNIIGSVYSTYHNVDTRLLYLQNYAGWNGFYWNSFVNIKCRAMQVRQAKLKKGTSAINENFFNGLYVRGGFERNNWNNVWIRNGNDGFADHTTIGTIESNDRWGTTFTSPFVVEHFDFSDTDAPDTVLSIGIRHDGPRPIVLKNGFIERHYYAYKGEMIAYNVEIRSCKNLPAISGNYQFDVSQKAGKVGNFAPTPAMGIIRNCEFKDSLAGFAYEDARVVPASDAVTTSPFAIEIIRVDSQSGIVVKYVSSATTQISIVVRGRDVGEIRHQSGDRDKQYGLGHKATGAKDEYIIARSTAFAGEEQKVWILPSSTGLTTVTGVQIFHGPTGYSIIQN